MSLKKLRRRSISFIADRPPHQGGKQSAGLWPADGDHSSPISQGKRCYRDWADPVLRDKQRPAKINDSELM